MPIPVYDPENSQQDFEKCFRTEGDPRVIKVADLVSFIKENSEKDFSRTREYDSILEAIGEKI